MTDFTPAPLVLEDVTRRFVPGGPAALDGLNLHVNPGELLTLLGPSGCGKTTTLRLIAGLDRPDSGRILIAGREVTRPFMPPERRGVGLVFQDYALFPHLTVLGNVLFGLHALPKAERLARARETLALVGLTVFESRRPHQLSGGQQQRVALARALAPRPALLLLDEPFSNLDAGLRHATRQEVRNILRRAGTAAILVTHDQEEAMAFSDRVAVLRGGAVEQVGPPVTLYHAPRTAFVANFIGRSNLLSGVGQGAQADTLLGRVTLREPQTGPLTVSVRPEQLRFADGESGVAATVTASEFQGRDTLYVLRIGGQDVLLLSSSPLRPDPGQQVFVRVSGEAQAVQ